MSSLPRVQMLPPSFERLPKGFPGQACCRRRSCSTVDRAAAITPPRRGAVRHDDTVVALPPLSKVFCCCGRSCCVAAARSHRGSMRLRKAERGGVVAGILGGPDCCHRRRLLPPTQGGVQLQKGTHDGLAATDNAISNVGDRAVAAVHVAAAAARSHRSGLRLRNRARRCVVAIVEAADATPLALRFDRVEMTSGSKGALTAALPLLSGVPLRSFKRYSRRPCRHRLRRHQ